MRFFFFETNSWKRLEWTVENLGLEFNRNLDIPVKIVKGRMPEKIVEKCQGLASWSRFGEKDLALLLKGVEACSAEKG